MSREVLPWSAPVALAQVQRSPVELQLTPDPATRARIASVLDLVELQRFEAEVRLTPWLDGVALQGRWRAMVVQTCGLSLDAFDTALEGVIEVKCAPAGSVVATPPEGEVVIDPDAEDPPDILESDSIDVGAYLVESLSLELDPFPRKPDAVYETPVSEAPPSPFAVLAQLKPPADSEPRN